MSFAELNLAAATPEIFLAVSAMVLLLLGVFQGDKFTRPLSWLAAAVLCIAAYLAADVAPATGSYLKQPRRSISASSSQSSR